MHPAIFFCLAPAWLLLPGSLFAAPIGHAPSRPGSHPPVLAGRIAESKERIAAARRVLGDHGCLSIRSALRWATVRHLLTELGWKPPEAMPFARPDFNKQMIVLVYKNGDVQDEFSVRRHDGQAKTPVLDIVMSYIIYKSRGEVVERCNFLLVLLPLQPKVGVTVSTFHPFNGGPYPTVDRANLEWQGAVGTEWGDVIDDLRGKIEAASARVIPGQDILVRFTLEHAGGAQVKNGPFVGQATTASVSVWDGKCSEGYRNHAFAVRGPDGKESFFRRPVIRSWDKNAPHPVQIELGQPYVLPEWREGEEFKSLRALGLDVSRSGRYEITGTYMEEGGKTKWDGKEYFLWSGNLATNTITVDEPQRV